MLWQTAMGRELCSKYSVFRNPVPTDDKPKMCPMNRGVGVVSFDTSQLDCTQPYQKGDAYRDSFGPLHQNIDVGIHHVELKNIQQPPNQYWNRGNYNGMYQAIANVESYGNHHSYTPPNFDASNEVNRYSPHWRRKLSKGATSFSSLEQPYYHGGHQVHSESHQNYHQYQSCGPKYHSFYHPHQIISTRHQRQHHLAHSPCYHQSRYHEGTNQESNGAHLRTGNIDASDREIEQVYPSTPPHRPHPILSQNRTYLQPLPNASGMKYNHSNVEYYPKLSEEQFRSDHSLTGIYDPVSRKRKHDDASCVQDNSTEYVVYIDRCMSPMSDISASSAASEQEDLFCQTLTNNPVIHQTVSEPMIDKRPDFLARRPNNVIEEVPSKNENQVSMEVPRIERGEPCNPFFSSDKNRTPVRTVTPMKIHMHNLQEGERNEYHEYEL